MKPWLAVKWRSDEHVHHSWVQDEGSGRHIRVGQGESSMAATVRMEDHSFGKRAARTERSRVAGYQQVPILYTCAGLREVAPGTESRDGRPIHYVFIYDSHSSHLPPCARRANESPCPSSCASVNHSSGESPFRPTDRESTVPTWAYESKPGNGFRRPVKGAFVICTALYPDLPGRFVLPSWHQRRPSLSPSARSHSHAAPHRRSPWLLVQWLGSFRVQHNRPVPLVINPWDL